jgi:hypothetical protein
MIISPYARSKSKDLHFVGVNLHVVHTISPDICLQPNIHIIVVVVDPNAVSMETKTRIGGADPVPTHIGTGTLGGTLIWAAPFLSTRSSFGTEVIVVSGVCGLHR